MDQMVGKFVGLEPTAVTISNQRLFYARKLSFHLCGLGYSPVGWPHGLSNGTKASCGRLCFPAHARKAGGVRRVSVCELTGGRKQHLLLHLTPFQHCD